MTRVEVAGSSDTCHIPPPLPAPPRHAPAARTRRQTSDLRVGCGLVSRCLSARPWGHQIWRVVDAPLTQTNRGVVVSGVRETHSDANAAYKYISKSGYFKPPPWSEQFKATTITYGEPSALMGSYFVSYNISLGDVHVEVAKVFLVSSCFGVWKGNAVGCFGMLLCNLKDVLYGC